MAYLTIRVIEKNRTISPDNSGHRLVVLLGFVVLCILRPILNGQILKSKRSQG